MSFYEPYQVASHPIARADVMLKTRWLGANDIDVATDLFTYRRHIKGITGILRKLFLLFLRLERKFLTLIGGSAYSCRLCSI